MLSCAVVDDPRPVLDYSSPAEERRRDRVAEDERREKVWSYNESTFGERRPIAAAFGRLAVVMVVAALGVLLLPRGFQRPFGWLVLIAYGAWEWRRKFTI